MTESGTPPNGESPGSAPTSITRNTAINLIGTLAPLGAALISIPVMNRWFGTERVGFLMLAWALIGYFGVLDLGIGRALTKLVAEKTHLPGTEELPKLIWTGLALMLVLGLFVGSLIAATASWLTYSVLRIPAFLQIEVQAAIQILGLSVPLIIVTAGLRGILEARGKFLASNLIRAPLGIWLFAGPLLAIPFGTKSLSWVTAALLIGRVLAFAGYAWFAWETIPGLRKECGMDRRYAGQLLKAGGWMTASNVVSPAIAQGDRFLLSILVPLNAIAWYSTPMELITKMAVIPGAVMSVLFPLLSALYPVNPGEMRRVFQAGIRTVALLVYLPTAGCLLFSGEGLTLWLGSDFSGHAVRIAKLVAAGSFLNSLATVPFALLQAAGRPDLTAKVHLAEFPLYAVLVFVLTWNFGIEGAALAWAIRMGGDLIILQILAQRVAGIRTFPSSGSILVAFGILASFLAALAPAPLTARIGLFLAMLLAEVAFVWRTRVRPWRSN